MIKLLPKLAFFSICLPLLLSHAFAKGKKDEKSTGTYGCARFDVNQNGKLDPEEIEALRKAFAEGDTALKLLDTNNDGKLDDAEIAAIKLPQPAGKKKKE